MLDEQSRKRLESLGYVGGDMTEESFKMDASKKDPKDLIKYYVCELKVMNLSCLKKYEEAKELCNKMLEEWPELYNTYFLLTRIASDNNLNDAIKYGEIYLKTMAGKVDLSQETSGMSPTRPIAKTHDLVAAAACQLDKNDLAIQHWTEALKLKADWPEVHNNIGVAYYKKGDIDKAVEHWKKALRLKPDWTDVRDNLDKIATRKKTDEIIAQYTDTLKRNPDDVDTHNQLAALYYSRGKIAEAIQHWSETVRLKPDLAEAKNNLAWLLAASRDTSLRNPAEAVRLAESACKQTDYNQPGILDTLGVTYASAGRFEDALKIAEKALQLAKSKNDVKTAADINSRIELYKKNKAYSD